MIKIQNHSGIYSFELKQQLFIDLKTAWDFFSSPDNLARITPPAMGFVQTSGKAVKMYAGQIITYKMGIFPLIKTNWVTEITHVQENSYFIDEQRFGPYKMWHHQHFFEENEQGVLMTDRVSYKVPFGMVGRLINEIVIERQLKEIFAFRYKTLEMLFSI